MSRAVLISWSHLFSVLIFCASALAGPPITIPEGVDFDQEAFFDAQGSVVSQRAEILPRSRVPVSPLMFASPSVLMPAQGPTYAARSL